MLTDVPGFLVGHQTLEDVSTGCTVILCPPGTVAGGHVCGGWPGSRDLAILDPTCASPGINAITFSGRSVFGLGVADGVIRWIHDNRDAGWATPGIVPQVPAAVINDLTLGDPEDCPTAEHGYLAAQNASTEFARGSVGAGTGASVGWLRREQARVKGGVGSASIPFGTNGVVGALSVVNPLGQVIDQNGEVLAGPVTDDGSYIDPISFAQEHPQFPRKEQADRAHTTLVAVATNAALDNAQCGVVARMAQAGIAAAIRPAFTPADGDIVIVASYGDIEAAESAIGTLAAYAVAESIRDAVKRTGNASARRITHEGE